MIIQSTIQLCILLLVSLLKYALFTFAEWVSYYLLRLETSFTLIELFALALSVAVLTLSFSLVYHINLTLRHLRIAHFFYFRYRILNVIVVFVLLVFVSGKRTVRILCAVMLPVIRLIRYLKKVSK